MFIKIGNLYITHDFSTASSDITNAENFHMTEPVNDIFNLELINGQFLCWKSSRFSRSSGVGMNGLFEYHKNRKIGFSINKVEFKLVNGKLMIKDPSSQTTFDLFYAIVLNGNSLVLSQDHSMGTEVRLIDNQKEIQESICQTVCPTTGKVETNGNETIYYNLEGHVTKRETVNGDKIEVVTYHNEHMVTSSVYKTRTLISYNHYHEGILIKSMIHQNGKRIVTCYENDLAIKITKFDGNRLISTEIYDNEGGVPVLVYNKVYDDQNVIVRLLYKGLDFFRVDAQKDSAGVFRGVNWTWINQVNPERPMIIHQNRIV